jgi:uncharacterized damage-inducible protein DinB
MTISQSNTSSIEQSAGDAPSVNHGRVLRAACELLAQGERLLAAVTIDAYTARLPSAFNATIGGHYRHCLDHFASWISGLDNGFVDYDARRRDVRLEIDPQFALETTRALGDRLSTVDPRRLDAPVRARCEVSYDHGASPVTGSSLGRELVYVIAHAIHHYALIKVMAGISGVPLPEDFGVAPSTVAHRRSIAA